MTFAERRARTTLRRWLAVLALALAAAATAGEFEEIRVAVPMRDGVRLDTRVHFPVAETPVPALLVRSPYGLQYAMTADERALFLRHGYAVVMQNTRGRYDSEGVFDPFRREADDGHDTLDWIVGQAWSDGSVGTFGASYGAFNQWVLAQTGHPALRALMPAFGMAGAYDFVYSAGAFRLRQWTNWAANMEAPYAFDREAFATRLDAINRILPVVEQDRSIGFELPYFRDWLAHPEYDAYWQRAGIDGRYADVRVPAYSIGGWYDMLLGNTLRDFTAMTSSAIDPAVRAEQRLIVGPWSHIVRPWPWAPDYDGRLGELDFGEYAVADIQKIRLRFFDRHLKAGATDGGSQAPVRLFVMGVNEWRDEEAWPLARARYRKFYFDSDGNANTASGGGTLSRDPPGQGPPDRYVYDPEDPVPSTADGSSFSPMTTYPHAHTAIERRQDVLVYTSAPLEQPLEVTGPIEVVLYAASSAINTDFTARLLDVHPDGKAYNLCAGIVRASHREGSVDVTPIVPGEVYAYRIDLVATSNVFLPGHRIRVHVSSSSFPQFDRNLNSALYPAQSAEVLAAEQTVYHDPKRPSHIVLPLIESPPSPAPARR